MGQEPATSPPQDPRIRKRRPAISLVEAVGGDHASISCFLRSILPGLSREEFNASLDDPFYEPCDRLLLRRRRQLAGHVRLTHRAMRFGAAVIPVAGLDGLAVAPEHRNQGLGSSLLEAAESRMLRDGALVGMLRTSAPHFFRRFGWALCPAASFRASTARALLARLLDGGANARSRRRLHIRPLLQWEHEALARVYRQDVLHDANGYGRFERTQPYWRWLFSRHAYDGIFVALEGPEQLELGEISTHLVGYAVTRGEQIVELMASPDCRSAATELLVRCCSDAIERDRYSVVLHAPPDCPLFPMFDEAGGSCPPPPVERGEVPMMRLVDALGFLRSLGNELVRRIAAAGLSRPCDLGLLVDGKKYHVKLGRDGQATVSQRLGPDYVRLNVADFTRLALGQLDCAAAAADGRIEFSSPSARELCPLLFPILPFWRSPWDDLPAIPQAS